MSEPTRLRITAWPGGAVPVPPVLAFPRVDLDGEWLVSSGSWEFREVAPELYLRDAADVDLADPVAIAAFTQKHGRLAPNHNLDEDLPRNVHMARAFHEHARSHGRTHQRPPSGETVLRVHVDEVGFRLRVLRNLTAHAVAYREGDYEAAVWPDYPTDERAWGRFTEFTNAALRPFHARVYVDRGDPDLDIGAPNPSLYEAAVLQLVNDLAEEAEYRVCPHCERVFVRQTERSQHYSRKRGVKFCSASCSRAAGVKAFRERQRTNKIQTDEGADHGER